MAQIGCLGDIVFIASTGKTEPINNMQWSGAARYGTHLRHLTNALTEFTGLDTDKISFDILLSAYLGVNPMAELAKIWQYERNATTLPLVVGSKGYGKYRWTIKDHKAKMQYFDADGDVTALVVSLNLLEYLK